MNKIGERTANPLCRFSTYAPLPMIPDCFVGRYAPKPKKARPSQGGNAPCKKVSSLLPDKFSRKLTSAPWLLRTVGEENTCCQVFPHTKHGIEYVSRISEFRTHSSSAYMNLSGDSHNTRFVRPHQYQTKRPQLPVLPTPTIRRSCMLPYSYNSMYNYMNI